MTPDDFKLLNYVPYALTTTGVTVWVGRSLHRAGSAFLHECFGGDPLMAASVNHLLLVGFYLLNFGALALLLKLETPPGTLNAMLEALAHKLGLALTSLGLVHLFNLWNFDALRRRAMNKRRNETSMTPPALPGVVVA